MKILVYNTKHCIEYFKYETKGEKLAATKSIFDENIGWYSYPKEDDAMSKTLV